MVLVIILYSINKINVYNAFLEGAKESIDMIISLFPTILAMILGINIIVNSGLLSILFSLFTPLLNLFKFPSELLPLAVIRPISGSAALAILNSIFEVHGPDSFIGILGSVMQGSTDTTFYVLTLYFGSIGVKKIKYAMWAGLFADLIGIISSFIIVKFLFC